MNLHPSFLKPLYGERCFSDLPGLLPPVLTGEGESPLTGLAGPLGERYDAVILIVLDGFGWRYQEQFGDHPFYRRVSREGALSQLTSQFPSTTAAHVTALHTGLTPGASGVFEWQYYDPAVDAVIVPLLFSQAGTIARDTLKRRRVDPRAIYLNKSIYPGLSRQGIRAVIFQSRAYTPSTYSDFLFAGAETFGYRSLPEALVTLAEMAARNDGPAYYHLYVDEIDGMAHLYGPAARQTLAQARVTLDALEAVLLPALPAGKRILLLVTADHGEMGIDPRTSIYLNRQPLFRTLRPWLRTDARGRLLPPGGSSRDMFLYVRPEHAAGARDLIAPALAGRADVVLTRELIDAGYFGPRISAAFRSRVADLVILPHPGEAVWWYQAGRFAQRFRGQHGGLSPEELLIPLAALPLG